MAKVKPILTEAGYTAALARIDELMDAEPGTPGGEELDALVDLVESYESKHVPMGFPSPIAALEFRMEQAGLAPRDLVPCLGSRAKVAEVLSGKRAITMPVARALHRHLGIPAEALLREPTATAEQPLAEHRMEPLTSVDSDCPAGGRGAAPAGSGLPCGGRPAPGLRRRR